MSDLPAWTADAVELTVALIRNACVNTGEPDSGNEIRSVRTIQKYLGDEGTVIEPLPTRASVVYRHKGTDPAAPTLLLIPHLDVVPASSADWSVPPFDGVQRDGFVWGRGAVDMLNVTGAMVALFKALGDGELPPPAGDIVLAAVADEEAGSVYGAQYLIEHHWDLIDCDAVLTEVAGPLLTVDGSTALPVTVAEKGPAWRHVSAAGIAGHGSQPYGRDNAVLKLAEAFHKLGSADQPVAVTGEWLAFVRFLPVSERHQAMLSDVDSVDAAIAEIAEDDTTLARWIHACTHLTVSPNVIEGGTKSNVVADAATGDVDVRLLPGQERADVDDHFRKVLGPALFDSFDIEPVLEMPANATNPTGPLWEAMADAAEDQTGSRVLAPTLTPVTTDARFFRARGIPAFGVGLFDDTISFAEMLAMFHGADERVSERSIRETAGYLARVVEHWSNHSSS